MPELPEVETIKNDLKKVILNKKIAEVKVGKKKMIKSDFKKFLQILKGNAFQDILRVGKLLMFKLKSGECLLIHLKMTGQLIYSIPPAPEVVAGGHEIPGTDNKLPGKYTHVIFEFADKSTLCFNDMRQFGYLKLADEEEVGKVKAKYGVEPLSEKFTPEKLKEILKNKTAKVKIVLMNQSLIAGIGNIYADEILFRAGVMPDKSAADLNEKEIKKIFNAIKLILAKAVKHRGTTFSDYVDSKGKKGNFAGFLKIYGRDGEKCEKCGNIIKKIKINGRGTRYCPKCQK